MARVLMVALIIAAATVGVRGGQEDPNQPLQQRITELEAKVQALEEIVSGTAHPINLGRTSLARVTASSVNGGRAMDNIYHGILNAFDDGDNWYDGLNYTSWLADAGTSWAEIYFDSPVSITSIQVEGNGPFAAMLDFALGGQERYPAVSSKLELATPVQGVAKVRLTFDASQTNCRVDEIMIFGYVSPGIEYAVRQPRVRTTVREARLAASAAFVDWWYQLFEDRAKPVVTEELDRFVCTFSRRGVDFLQVVVDKSTGASTTTELAGFGSCPPDPNQTVSPGQR
jgi:hypothetical protein